MPHPRCVSRLAAPLSACHTRLCLVACQRQPQHGVGISSFAMRTLRQRFGGVFAESMGLCRQQKRATPLASLVTSGKRCFSSSPTSPLQSDESSPLTVSDNTTSESHNSKSSTRTNNSNDLCGEEGEDALLALHFSTLDSEASPNEAGGGAGQWHGDRNTDVDVTGRSGFNPGASPMGNEEGNGTERTMSFPSSSSSRQRNSNTAMFDDGYRTSDGTGQLPPPPTRTYRVLRLHNLPRNWLHDDIAQFIDQVAEQEGIEPPSTTATSGREQELNDQEEQQRGDDEKDGEEASAGGIPQQTTSPFLHHLTVFFGRRTGIVFGSPRLVLNNSALCDALLRGVQFDPDDYRARIYFTEEKIAVGADEAGSEGGGAAGFRVGPGVSSVRVIEESMEAAQQAALDQLELDRFLFAPDLLYDIQRLHQRRLVTRNEAILLDAFVDGEEDEDGDIEAALREDSKSAKLKRRKRSGKGIKKKKAILAREQSHLGRGSMQNMPIPKPYVQGRRI